MEKFHEGPHKYKRLLLGKRDYYVYRCMREGCTHFIQLKLAIGRETLCWGSSPDCLGKTFITDENIELKTVRPLCEKCKEWKREQKEVFATIPMIEEGEDDD
jgi:hypothetical protein